MAIFELDHVPPDVASVSAIVLPLQTIFEPEIGAGVGGTVSMVSTVLEEVIPQPPDIE